LILNAVLYSARRKPSFILLIMQTFSYSFSIKIQDYSCGLNINFFINLHSVNNAEY
jgi:hypothetical protein